MSGHVTIDQQADGCTVAVKRAGTPADEDRLRRSAEQLAAIDHPGVVRLVELAETEAGIALVTEYVGPRTLATAGLLGADRAATLATDLATTVADLHSLGIVHGAIRPDHVLVSGERTVLCGFAPPSPEGPDAPTTADDVCGIGVVLRAILAPTTEEEPIPDRRPWRRHAWHGYRHGALLTLADQATADEPGRRPSARALADAIAHLQGPSPSASTPSRAAPSIGQSLVDLAAVRLRWRPRHEKRERRPPRLVIAAGVGVLAVSAGVMTFAQDVSPAANRRSGPPLDVAPGGCSRAVDDRRHVDIDGDGCSESLRIGRGWVEVGQQRYRVGRPGNDLAVGDWDCDGIATVALLRRGLGEVWAFTSWDPEAAVTAEAVGTFPGAIGLRSRSRATCDDLLVERRDGSLVGARGT